MKPLMKLALASAMVALSSPSAQAWAAPAKAEIGAWGVETAGISKTVRPGDDFFRFVNEGWLKSSSIPAGFAFMDGFVQAYLATEARVGTIISDARKNGGAPGSPEQMIGDFHRSHADMARRNALGITPVATALEIISKTSSRDGLAGIMAFPWMNGPIGAAVLPDADNPRRQIAAVGVGGLTMPSRDYYLADAEPYIGHRKALQTYMADSFRRAGISDPEARAAKVLALEIEIARRQWPLADQRDVVRMNNVMTPAQLNAYAPGFPWSVFMAEYGFGPQERIKVTTDTATRDVARLFAETPAEDLQSFLLFKTLDGWADSLSEPWVQAHFDFHNKRLNGTPQRRPAELESITSVSGTLGEEIGRLYVARHFGADDKAKVEEMVGYLKATYRERIARLDWMDAPTKAEAQKKLDRMAVHIGYPERWHDRSMVKIAADDFAGNQLRLATWARADKVRKLAEGTRDWEFPYPAHEVNAGYMASANSMTYPAGILQPPFFDPKADPAVNFGSIAAVIGHEIGHGFDDQGSRSDGDGKLRDWWSKASRAEFEKRTAGLVDQYNQYEVLPGLKINGRQNLGENIGDLGGLSVAYAAYQTYVKEKQGGKAPVIDGYTGDQRFFLAWAQVWRSLINEGEIRRRTLSDPHSIGEFRVNGVVRNVDAWYTAFNVKPGDKLYLAPEKRVKIW
jgi:endothelin-converting enzyme/putative endopeptidase